jgi:glycosyltransferase involved in cell wall biosynthesis
MSDSSQAGYVQAKQPRVLYITPVLEYPPRGGPWLRVYNTIKALSRQSQLSILSLLPLEAIGGEQAYRHLLGLADAVYLLPSDFHPAKRRRGFISRIRRQLALLNYIAEVANSISAEVIWLGFGNISYHLLPLKVLTRCKLVVDTDSVWSRWVLRELPLEPRVSRKVRILLQGWRKRMEEVVGTNYADITLAVSDVDMAYYRRITPFATRVMLLSNVIDVDAYADPVDDISFSMRKPALCCTGTMGSASMVDAVIWLLDQVMPMVWEYEPDLHLYIVGRDPPEEICIKQNERVMVTGSVSSVVPYLRNADVALVANRFESGTRFKILEAFACQTPVVSTTLGAEGLAVKHEKHLLLADSPQDFAAAILRLLSDSELRRRLVIAAYQLVKEQYSIRIAETQVRSILESLGVKNPRDTGGVGR